MLNTSQIGAGLLLSAQSYTFDYMDERPLMTADEINAFGVEIVTKQLEKDGWAIEYADGLADIRSEPQIAANKDGEQAFFVVRTGLYPSRGRFDEGTATFEKLVRHAKAHGASCYFASVGIANGEGNTEEEMSIPVKGAGYNIEFDGLIKMELPPATADGNSSSRFNAKST